MVEGVKICLNTAQELSWAVSAFAFCLARRMRSPETSCPRQALGNYKWTSPRFFPKFWPHLPAVPRQAGLGQPPAPDNPGK